MQIKRLAVAWLFSLFLQIVTYFCATVIERYYIQNMISKSLINWSLVTHINLNKQGHHWIIVFAYFQFGTKLSPNPM